MKLFPLLALIVFGLVPVGLAEPWLDPAVPTVISPPDTFETPEAQPFDRLVEHQQPRPLPPEAVTEDWPRFLGPRDNATSLETGLVHQFPEGGPPLLWELEKGEGYTGPIISGDHLVVFHRLDGEELVECLDPLTGRRRWSHADPVEYRDRYGYANGPRGSPVIDEDRVYVYGVTGRLRCLHLPTGMLLWQRDLGEEFKTRSAFFGVGSSPLIHGEKIVVPVGGTDGPAVAAFDKKTGKLLWGAEQEWGASYASPVAATIHGTERLLVLAGGESRPPHGGLLVLEPASGKVQGRYPWRADKFESVNAVTPLAIGDAVFLSECYGPGGVLLDLAQDGTPKPRWTAEGIGIHWMNPIVLDGHLYGVDGRHPQDGELVCYEIASGVEKWREQFLWQAEIGGNPTTVGILRGSLLVIDGSVLCLGEFGALLWLELTPEGGRILDRCQPFMAQESWTLPCVSHGLLYLAQHQKDPSTGSTPRWRCYDLRGD